VDNQAIFEEGLEIVRKLWAADGRISHRGKHYSFDDVRITPKPVQRPIPSYVRSVSRPSIELAARLECGLIVAPFTAAMSFGGLQQVADLYHETCAKHGTKLGRLMCSYFIHFANNKAQEDAQRARPHPLLPRMRDSRPTLRSEHGAAELLLRLRHGRSAAEF
jgi:alkanesulfonate monooxygenase SsuD/methylene tetrahydromethanopterin reductase-like flavin-dependent oxidoreductase (luciferase family)